MWSDLVCVGLFDGDRLYNVDYVALSSKVMYPKFREPIVSILFQHDLCNIFVFVELLITCRRFIPDKKSLNSINFFITTTARCYRRSAERAPTKIRPLTRSICRTRASQQQPDVDLDLLHESDQLIGKLPAE
jgi:hypothetical protein